MQLLVSQLLDVGVWLDLQSTQRINDHVCSHAPSPAHMSAGAASPPVPMFLPFSNHICRKTTSCLGMSRRTEIVKPDGSRMKHMPTLAAGSR
jgi:hypothetical protein